MSYMMNEENQIIGMDYDLDKLTMPTTFMSNHFIFQNAIALAMNGHEMKSGEYMMGLTDAGRIAFSKRNPRVGIYVVKSHTVVKEMSDSVWELVTNKEERQ